jgi:putrescine transport system permease protein
MAYHSFLNLWQRGQQKLQGLYQGAKQRQYFFVVAAPYLWLLIFFFLPFILILKISFSSAHIGLPPYTAISGWNDQNILSVILNMGNYVSLFEDSFYVSAFLSSILIACSSTLCSLMLGYLMAYGISRASHKWRTILLLLVVLPFWTSFLVRVYAWMSLLSTRGLVNTFLLKIGFIQAPLLLLDTPLTVCLGIVYCYLPFMILPIYAALEKIDTSYLEAAFDLGSTPWRAFWRITVPLSSGGIVAGCVLVFIPSIGEFVIPEILGGPDTLMIGRALWWEFFNNRDWPLACALAVSMVLFFVVPIMVFQRRHLRAQENREGGL